MDTRETIPPSVEAESADELADIARAAMPAIEPTLEALLSDGMTLLLMRADGISAGQIEAIVAAVRRSRAREAARCGTEYGASSSGPRAPLRLGESGRSG